MFSLYCYFLVFWLMPRKMGSSDEVSGTQAEIELLKKKKKKKKNGGDVKKKNQKW